MVEQRDREPVCEKHKGGMFRPRLNLPYIYILQLMELKEDRMRSEALSDKAFIQPPFHHCPFKFDSCHLHLLFALHNFPAKNELQVLKCIVQRVFSEFT